MKKISLVLALVLAVSCLLVACGGETETSSTPATESSVAATESSEAATEESSEAATESSEAATESSVAEESKEAPEAGTENIAAGKTYTLSVLYRQGSAGYDANAPISYPDEEGKTLTDGILPADDAKFSAPEWVGFNGQDPEYIGYHSVTLDLGEKTDLAKFVFKYGTSALTAGIVAPATIEIFVSDDGETWGDRIGGDVPTDDTSSVNGVYELEAGASGRYVQFRFTSTGWAFVSEVEVYGAAE